MPLGVVAVDDSTLCLESSTNGQMIGCSPEAVSPRESTVEETSDRRDDVDSVGVVVLGDLEDDFGHRLLIFEECPWLPSEGAGEIGRLKMLNILEDFDCLELCGLSFAMSIKASSCCSRRRNDGRCHLSVTENWSFPGSCTSYSVQR
jgi:hypothetical protein